MKVVVFLEWARVKEVILARDAAHAQELIDLHGGSNALRGTEFRVFDLRDPDDVLSDFSDKAYQRGIWAGQESCN